MSTKTSGFTIVELIVALAVVVLLVLPVGNFAVASYASVLRTRAEIKLKLENVAVIRTLSDEIRLGVNLRANNSISDANKSGGWTASSAGQVLIVSTIATNSSNAVLTNGSGVPYKNEQVYFVSGTDLYVRSLANASATGNSLQTSCPSAVATTSCPADRKLASNVKSFTYSMYDATGASTTTFSSARSLLATIVLEKGGKSTVTATNKFRVALRNSG